MTVGSNPTDRSKLGTKRHILTDKKGIPLSAVISSAKTHDIKLVTKMWLIMWLSGDHHPNTEIRE
jgi:IS5 family transposase